MPALKTHIYRSYRHNRREKRSLCVDQQGTGLEWKPDQTLFEAFDHLNQATCFRCRTAVGLAKTVTLVQIPEGQMGYIVKYPKRKPMAYASRPDMEQERSLVESYEGNSDYWAVPERPQSPCALCGRTSWKTDYPDPFAIPLFEVANPKLWTQHVIASCVGRQLLLLEQRDGATVRLGAVRCASFNPVTYLHVGLLPEAPPPKSRFTRLLEADSAE